MIDTLKQYLDNKDGSSVDEQYSVMKSSTDLEEVDAILFLSKDARDFMETHCVTFLSTLAHCLTTERDKILMLDMPHDIFKIV
ncbi:hypothetical protein ACF0H5_013763 [Mactra antiquata]